MPLQTYQVSRGWEQNKANLAVDVRGFRLELQIDRVEDKQKVLEVLQAASEQLKP